MSEKGVSNIALADALGVAAPTISYMVTGKTSPSLATLSLIADILNVKVWELFKEYRELNPPTAPQVPTNNSQAIICPKCGAAISITVTAE